MAYRFDSTANDLIGQAIAARRELRETPASFGYGGGVAMRFAGMPQAERKGLNGALGSEVNDPKNKDAQRYFKDWTSQWTSGPYGPDMGMEGMA